MPANNVIITGIFSQTPVKSNGLAILDVNVNATVVPNLTSGQYNYTADIPHIIQTASENPETGTPDVEEDDAESPTDPVEVAEPPVQTFRIIAVPEDPQADVTVSPAADANGEYELVEGKTEYTVTVAREGFATTAYTFSVSYWPDLSLSSITLSSEGHDDWTHNVPLQDEQKFTVPYNNIDISAIAADAGVELSASKTSGSGNFTGNTPASEGEAAWTLVYPGGMVQSASTVRIKSSKTAGGTLYEKEYILNFVKPVEIGNIPTTHWAEGGGVSIVQDEDGYYEVHTFISNDTLTFKVDIKDSGLMARVLVVAGGGGGGGATYPSFGGGAGGMVENDAYSLAEQSYEVVVGLGGAGGNRSNFSVDKANGQGGNDSQFSNNIIAYGGGGGSTRYSNIVSDNPFPGRSGGSSGGGTSSPPVKIGIGGESYGHIGGILTTNGDYGAGGGGAGGTGKQVHIINGNNSGRKDSGGPGKPSNITGASVVYAAGGWALPEGGGAEITGINGEANTGNGGSGS
jgi:hypothetical protein